MDARLVLRSYYESHYGIHDHLSPERVRHPLDGVLFRESEDSTKNSVLYDRLENFVEKRYYETWGLDIERFMRLPRFVIQMIEEITDRHNSSVGRAAESITNELNSQLKQSK